MVAVVGICFIIYHLCFEFTVMTSGSMGPTLKGESYEDGDRILVEKVTGWFRRPKRWEIYTFYNNDGTFVAKRIVGLPGETISIKENRVCINGNEIKVPASLSSLKYYPVGNLSRGREVNCGDGYFVLGDDSKDSYDSRFEGPVRGARFLGRVCCIMAPSDRAGLVH